MKVYLNKISGYASAIISMYMSKRSYTRKLEKDIYELEWSFTTADGTFLSTQDGRPMSERFYDELRKVCKIGQEHITLLRFIDLEFTADGIHRGAQDDFDAHAKRLDNRIVRASTRLADFNGDEKSEYYKGKILTTEEVLKVLYPDTEAILPEQVTYPFKDFGTEPYVKVDGLGYVRESELGNNDVLRGLYRLSIPSTFTTKCNLTEFAHIVKLRDKNSNAAPELKEMIEQLLVQIEERCPLFTREFFYDIQN